MYMTHILPADASGRCGYKGAQRERKFEVKVKISRNTHDVFSIRFLERFSERILV